MAAEGRRVPAARTRTRVRYPETDRMGVAHHTHFFVWFELGRTELMRELGCTYRALEEGESLFFPVIRATAAYHAPARYDEEVLVATHLVRVGGARVEFEYAVSGCRDGTLLATGSTVHAAVDRQGRPRRIPDHVRRRLSGQAEED